MRSTSTFRQIAPGLHAVDCDAYDRGLHIPLRMPVIEGSDGLVLYSPVPFDDDIAAQIGALGDVAHVVAPNLNHDKFFATVAARYPRARRWGPPGMAKRRPDLDLETGALAVGVEAVMLEGVPFTRELVMLHAASASLICADMVHNIHEEPSLPTRLLWQAMGSWRRFGPNRYWKWKTVDREAFARSMDTILDWRADRVVMSHGEVLESGGAEALEEAMRWVGDGPR